LRGLIVLALGYWIVERRLQLHERAERAKEAERGRRENRVAVLTVVHAELEGAAAKVTTALEELPHEDQRLIYPLFETSMWTLVTSADVFTTLKLETAEALMRTYNRMMTANEQNAFLMDMHQGPTSLVVTTAAAESIESNKLVRETYESFLGYREYIRTALIKRLKELKPHLDDAIDAVEAELELMREPSAAHRVYRPDEPPQYAGEGPPGRAHAET
jgi:hypothetical protein